MNPTTADTRATPSQADEPRWRQAAGLQLLGQVQGSGMRDPAYLVRRADDQVVQLSELLHLVVVHADPSRPAADVAAAVSERYGRTLTTEGLHHLVTTRLEPLGLVLPGEAEEPTSPVRARPLLALTLKATLLPRTPDAGRGQDAATDVLAARRRRRPGGPGRRRRRPRRRRRLLAGPDPGARHSDHGPAHLRPARRVSRGARAGPRGRLPLRGRRARRDRRRRLHRLPGLLHRRHRLLPAGPRRPGAHRSRRPLLQRADRRGVRAPVRRHGQRPVAADRAGAAAADAAAAHPGRPVRRLLHPVRPGRRTRPVRQGRTGAALPPAGAASRSARHRAEAPGAPVRDRLGAGRRAAADGCAGVGHLARAGLRRRRPSRHPAAAAGLRRGLGAPRLGCHGPGRRVDRTDPGPAGRADGRAVANRRARSSRSCAGRPRPWPAGRSTA